jgi:hypothetical protein
MGVDAHYIIPYQEGMLKKIFEAICKQQYYDFGSEKTKYTLIRYVSKDHYYDSFDRDVEVTNVQIKEHIDSLLEPVTDIDDPKEFTKCIVMCVCNLAEPKKIFQKFSFLPRAKIPQFYFFSIAWIG